MIIRKWGTWPAQVWDDSRDMTIPKKYDIGFFIQNCDYDTLKFLEPWCSNIYVSDIKLMLDYQKDEQKN